jgi:hypothetical protein
MKTRLFKGLVLGLLTIFSTTSLINTQTQDFNGNLRLINNSSYADF